jgi:hypothetical protein
LMWKIESSAASAGGGFGQDLELVSH